MAGENVGNIVYEVEMNVARMIEGQRQVNDRLDQMDSKFNKTGRSVAGAEKSLSSLTRVATALTAALSVQQVAHYADAWTTLNNKLSNSVRANESLIDVTQRVFDITQSTRSSLDATATLYARLERGTRSYNTSAADLAKLTTIINQGFVVSGATATEAENAIIQLSQGIASGVLRGEEFNSVTEQGSRLAVALADSLGVGIGQLRAMAAEGKLTTDVVVKGLLSQGDAIGKEFANTTTTIGQAMQVASNNITQFVGSSTTVKAAVAVFNSVIVTLSTNLEAVSSVVLTLTGIMGSRYVGALSAAAANQLTAAAAAYRLASAQGAMASAATIARGALSLIGGPAGAATLAAAAIFYFYQKAQQAKQESIDFADKLDGVISKMKEMNQTQLGAEIAKAEQSIIDQKDAIKGLRGELDALQQKRAFIEQAAQVRGASAVAEDYQQVQRDIAIQAGKVDSAENKLSQTVSKVGLMRAQLNGNLAQGIDLLKRDGDQAGVAAGLMNQFGNALDFASRQKEKFNSQSLKVERPKNVQDYLDDQQRQVELQSELNERKRDQLKAEQDIRKLGGSEADVALARQRAGAEYDSLQAQKNLKKETRDGVSEAKKAATQAESNAQKLADLKQQSELSAEGTRQLSREQAILAAQQSLNAGASQEDIRLAGEYAAKKWDVTNALKAQAAAEKLLPEAQENANYKQDVQDLNTALSAKKISQQQYNSTMERLEEEHQVNLAKIRANQVVSPQQEALGTIDPVQALANENAQKLALIQQFETQKGQITQRGLDLMNAANSQYEQQRIAAQWQILSQQSLSYDMLTSAVDAFAGNASNALTGLLTGTMSVDDALRSLGNTILNSVINSIVQMGVEYAKNLIIQQTLGTAAVAATSAQALAAAAAWATPAALAATATSGGAAVAGNAALATTVGSAQAMALAGARKNGGPVSAGSMYQVGESGLPEIYQASTGKQYMIPGDNGKVISNKDMQSGGAMNVVVNFNDYASGDHSYDYQSSQDGNTLTIDAFIMDISNGGKMSQAISSFHNAPRKARGG